MLKFRAVPPVYPKENGSFYMEDSTEKSLILVVDDDPDCRETLADLLSNEGYSVVCAENGREALDYLSGSKPSLIILDLMMPAMSGWEFRARQKLDPNLESLPVVVTTASGLVQDIEADAILHKPIDVGVLLDIVRQNCSAKVCSQDL